MSSTTTYRRCLLACSVTTAVLIGSGGALAQTAQAIEPAPSLGTVAANTPPPPADIPQAQAPAPVPAPASAAPPTTVAALAPSTPTPSLAPIFAEDFSFADSAWSLVDARIADGMMTHTPKPEHWSNAFYYGALFKDADVRVKARIMETSERSATASSLAFWHSDSKNFYVLTFWHDSGFIRVTRYQDGNTIAVVEKTIDKFQLPADGWVEMRLVAKGNVATVYIDGTEQAKFKGFAPAQGWKIGMFASAPKTGNAAVAFRDLKVY